MFIVFDLDGTLALNEHRQHHLQKKPKDWDAFFDACDADEPHLPILEVMATMVAAGHRVEIWSGRTEKQREKTIAWFERHGAPTGVELKMRRNGDFRPDEKVKGDWLEASDAPPALVFDDRNSMVAWWRAKGICCAQVALGEF